MTHFSEREEDINPDERREYGRGHGTPTSNHSAGKGHNRKPKMIPGATQLRMATPAVRRTRSVSSKNDKERRTRGEEVPDDNIKLQAHKRRHLLTFTKF
jgi:hypothetical protein